MRTPSYLSSTSQLCVLSSRYSEPNASGDASMNAIGEPYAISTRASCRSLAATVTTPTSRAAVAARRIECRRNGFEDQSLPQADPKVACQNFDRVLGFELRLARAERALYENAASAVSGFSGCAGHLVAEPHQRAGRQRHAEETQIVRRTQMLG